MTRPFGLCQVRRQARGPGVYGKGDANAGTFTSEAVCRAVPPVWR
jgi:hypothetical protein